jgi:hypothetical protein
VFARQTQEELIPSLQLEEFLEKLPVDLLVMPCLAQAAELPTESEARRPTQIQQGSNKRASKVSKI